MEGNGRKGGRKWKERGKDMEGNGRGLKEKWAVVKGEGGRDSERKEKDGREWNKGVKEAGEVQEEQEGSGRGQEWGLRGGVNSRKIRE